MPSRSETIVARVATLLTGTTAAGASIYRDRQDALTREESPAILIEMIDEDSSAFGGGRPSFAADVDEDTVRFAVTVCVRNASWQTVADGVRVQAHARIMADTTLLALVASLRRDRCEWQPQKTDLPFGYAAQVYLAKFLTKAHALDQNP